MGEEGEGWGRPQAHELARATASWLMRATAGLQGDRKGRPYYTTKALLKPVCTEQGRNDADEQNISDSGTATEGRSIGRGRGKPAPTGVRVMLLKVSIATRGIDQLHRLTQWIALYSIVRSARGAWHERLIWRASCR